MPRDHGSSHSDREPQQVLISMIVVNYRGMAIEPSPTKLLDFDSQPAQIDYSSLSQVGS